MRGVDCPLTFNTSLKSEVEVERLLDIGMEEKTAPGKHPKPLPGFEMAYYPTEWLYYDEEELAGDGLEQVGEKP